MFNIITPDKIADNMFDAIGRGWMLITAKNKVGKVNTMTASWGMSGILWNRPVAVCFIRPQRYTCSFANEAEYYTLSFLGEEYRAALRLCGGKSGRDVDKFAEGGISHFPIELEDSDAVGNSDVVGIDAVGIEQARMILVCKKLYVDDLKKGNFLSSMIPEGVYPTNDFHRFFIGEIVKVLVK